MWRLMRSRPAAMPWGTRALTQQVEGSQTVHIQKIQIRRPTVGTRARNVLVTAGVAFVCFTVYSSFVLSPWSQFIQKHIDELDDKEKEQLSDPVFIPFPLTLREVQSEPYRGTDPEWVNFIKASKDKALQNKIRGEIADIVRHIASANPFLVQKCGNLWKIRRYWVDVDYPYRPPPKYLRSGIEIREDSMVWTSKEMDPNTARRMRRILWPSPMGASMFHFARVLFKQNLSDATKAVGFRQDIPSQQTSAEVNAMRQAAEKLRGASTKDPTGVKDPTAAAKQPIPERSGAQEGSGAGSPATVSPPSVKDSIAQRTTAPPPSAAKNNSDTNKIPSTKDLLPYESLRSNIKGALAASVRTFRQKLRPLKDQPPPGCILVSGLVELETQKAYVVIDVFAWYDPKANSYDFRSMFMNLRRLQYKQQSPQR